MEKRTWIQDEWMGNGLIVATPDSIPEGTLVTEDDVEMITEDDLDLIIGEIE